MSIGRNKSLMGIEMFFILVLVFKISIAIVYVAGDELLIVRYFFAFLHFHIASRIESRLRIT